MGNPWPAGLRGHSLEIQVAAANNAKNIWINYSIVKITDKSNYKTKIKTWNKQKTKIIFH